MPVLVVTTRDGTERTIEAAAGSSLMEVLRSNGITEVQALCGGCRSCATCHVILDPAYVDRLEPMSDEEDALLDGSSYRAETSRLACQIKFSDKLDGMRCAVAHEG